MSKTPPGWPEGRFVPATRPVVVDSASGVVYRPLRSWHSGVFAGERLEIANGDRSGCMMPGYRGIKVTTIPHTYTHRLYWRRGADRTISAFLSYPNGMGACDHYFWEASFGGGDGGCKRFNSEEECEAAIIARLLKEDDA